MSDGRPYLIFALPRCRTAWCSRFLSYGSYQCGHDELRHCRSLEDIASWLSQPCTGTIETAAAPFWRLLPAGVTVATIRRPIPEVLASLRRGGLTFDDEAMAATIRQADAKLVQIQHRLPGVLATTFEELGTEEGCARLFEHCLPYAHDRAWWEHFDPINMQISLPHLHSYMVAHRPQLLKLAKTAKHRCITTMQQEQGEIDGVTFQHEPFRAFYQDAKHLFAEHLVQTDEPPDNYASKNIPLYELLDDHGILQTMTARCNGRMFGYLVSIVAPSLDSPTKREALHTIFFASPDIRGLGMKLQRAALARLRELGVDDLFMRAGHRGSGPRLGTFYKRLGAEEFGQVYRLQLRN